MKRSAFTLIELLVVVSIIVLLIAILLPSMSRARELAKRTACASNLHQLSLSTYYYTTDFKGHYPYRGAASDPNPATWWTSGFTDDRALWKGYIADYTVAGGSTLFWCPSNPWPFDALYPRQRWPHNTAGVFRYQAGYNFFGNIHSSLGTWRPGRNVISTVMDVKAGDQLWTDFAEDKTVPLGSWRLVSHSRVLGDHEFSTLGPEGLNSSGADGSVRWYNHSADTELASYSHNAITGDWWGKTH
ncbi:MAG: DUF1559 domain-containing protein [Planctomycetes bacterium]|nr:DUF1559 domain-containing protein [Planctomycetota bacterium]